jgi:hypothetical protein
MAAWLVSLLAVRLWAAPTSAAAARDFPATFTRAAAAGLAADPFYGSKLLGSLDRHVKTLAAMSSPAEVRAYLRGAAGVADDAGKGRLARSLDAGALEPEAAAALLAASALERPEWFSETLDGLEGLRPDHMGKAAAKIFAEAEGRGDRRLVEALRAAVSRIPRAAGAGYGDELALAALFDKGGPRAGHAAGEESVLAAHGALHPSGLERPGAAGVRFKTPEGAFKTLSPAEFEAKFGARYVPVMPKDAPEDAKKWHGLYHGAYEGMGRRPNHLAKIDYHAALDAGRTAELYVAKVSEAVGYGLFAARKIADGELIAEYTGTLRKKVPYEEQRRNAYLFQLPGHGDWFVDAETAGNYARFANHSSKRPNTLVMFGFHDGYYHVLLIAGKDIAQDEQIVYDYGSDYWTFREKPEEL